MTMRAFLLTSHRSLSIIRCRLLHFTKRFSSETTTHEFPSFKNVSNNTNFQPSVPGKETYWFNLDTVCYSINCYKINKEQSKRSRDFQNVFGLQLSNDSLNVFSYHLVWFGYFLESFNTRVIPCTCFAFEPR